ncbi:MAG TPA: methyltransferase domain-containing protein [Gaiellaceae bacterium]
MGEIRRYVEEREAARTRGTERGAAVRALRRVSSFELRQRAKVWGTDLVAPLERRKAKRLAEARPLRLHLGSGGHELDGWVNVDLVGMGSDLHWDLTHRLPFEDGSAQAVFLEHVLEHFPLATVLEMLAEATRVLAPGGILRAGVPDFGRYAESYAGDRAFLEGERPGRPTPLLALVEVVYSHGHRSAWDAETLAGVLTESGLVDVRSRAFGDSALEPAPDNPIRESETVYAEGRKP